MDRRIALKNMGYAMGLTVATPTIISLLQSCGGETGPDWAPVFFSADQGAVLVKLVDIILPKTDTPSASEVGVHSFLDGYMDAVPEQGEQDMLKMSLDAFIAAALEESGKASAADLTAEDLEPVLAARLTKQTEEEETAMYEAIGSYQEAMASGQEAALDGGIASRMFANNLRGAVIWSYRTSEQIGENVLAYLPVPGEYIPCGDVNELTGGKAWSI